jgi:HK97 family phage portal protein
MARAILAGEIGSSTTYTDPESDATVIACMDLIANSTAKVTYDIYDRDTRQKIRDHYLYPVFRNPNWDEPRSVFEYHKTIDYFHGNVFLYKYVNNTTGLLESLFRLNPLGVTVERNAQNQKIYTYNGKQYDYTNILHIPARWGYDGMLGKSIFDFARSAFNTGKEIDSYVNSSFQNSLGKRLVVDISTAFPNATKEEVEAIKQKYVNNYTGSSNAGKPIIKSNKVDFTILDSGLSDSRAMQLVENRQFQESEYAKIFGVALSFLKGDNKYGSIESLYDVLIDTAIEPICSVTEQYYEMLMTPLERERYYVAANYNTIKKTSLSDRIDAYTKQLNNAILTVNEVRSKENLEPVEGGDTLWRPSNMIPVRIDVEEAMLAAAKLKAQELVNPNPANNIGSDKI